MLAKCVRVITIPPVMATVLTILMRVFAGAFPGVSLYLTILYLAVLPTLAYPLSCLIPALKKRGRSAQRDLALALSLLGYMASVLTGALMGLGKTEMTIAFTYLITACVMLAFQVFFDEKVSGHASGFSGPVCMLALTVSRFFIFLYLLLIPVYLSSIKLKRHTKKEFLLGTLIPVATELVLVYCVS